MNASFTLSRIKLNLSEDVAVRGDKKNHFYTKNDKSKNTRMHVQLLYIPSDAMVDQLR